MEKPLKVVINGDTLVLSCLRASLASYADLEVVSLERPAKSEQELRSLRPDVVIFDLQEVDPASLYALAWKLPDLRLVGLDPDRNRATLWSGQQLQELGTQDLVRLIGHVRPHPPTTEG